MDRLAFNASAAIAESRTAQHMVNNELANVSTPGFKRSFESAMQSVKAEGAGFASRIQPKSLNVDTIIMTAGIAHCHRQRFRHCHERQGRVGRHGQRWHDRLHTPR